MFAISLAMFGEHLMPAQAWLGLIFFLYLFGALGAYYSSVSITVDSGGLTLIGPASFRWVPWGDVVGVSVMNPYFPGYEVSTREGGFGFSGMVFQEHRRLYDLIVAYSRKGDVS